MTVTGCEMAFSSVSLRESSDTMATKVEHGVSLVDVDEKPHSHECIKTDFHAKLS
jgi:hypothetical protein